MHSRGYFFLKASQTVTWPRKSTGSSWNSRSGIDRGEKSYIRIYYMNINARLKMLIFRFSLMSIMTR